MDKENVLEQHPNIYIEYDTRMYIVYIYNYIYTNMLPRSIRIDRINCSSPSVC